MGEFSLTLPEDVQQIQKWVHDFAEDVIRPVAHEWDEREEFPWPVVQGGGQDRALRLRLHGQGVRRPDRADAAGRRRGAVLGRRRHRPGHLRLGPGRRRHLRQRHARAGHGVGAAVLRHRRRREARRVLRVASPTPAPTCRRCAPAPSTTRPRTSGCSTAPRRGSPTAASPTCTSWWPPSIPSLKGRGQASFVVPPGTRGLSQGQKYKKHGIRASHTAEVILDDVRVPGRCLLGGKDKLDAKLARARDGRPLGREAAGDGDVRGHPPGRRRAGARHRPGRLRVRARLRQGARRRSASRSS